MTTSPRAEWTTTKTVQLSPTLSAEMTMGPGGMTTEWSPDLEAAKKMSKRQLQVYRMARNELARDVAAQLGKSVVIIIEI